MDVPALTYSTSQAIGYVEDLEDEGSAMVMADEHISMAQRYCRCRNMDACRCGENNEGKQWCWDTSTMSSACDLSDDGMEVTFHPRYSIGTSCIRGNESLRHGFQHYFEVKILTPCFGTDIMVGLGTDKANLRKYEYRYASLLGDCKETWGMSYKGSVYHNDQWSDFHEGFGQGTLVGVHVDLWRGRVAYHINRKFVGVAFVNLKDPSAVYYPMVCSTAARSRVRLIAARSYDTNLQYFCCNAVRHAVRDGERFLPNLLLPPALKSFLSNNLGWLMVGVATENKSRTGNRDDDPSWRRESNSNDANGNTGLWSRGTRRGGYVSSLAHFTHRLALIPSDNSSNRNQASTLGFDQYSPVDMEDASSTSTVELDDEEQYDGPKPSKNPRFE